MLAFVDGRHDAIVTASVSVAFVPTAVVTVSVSVAVFYTLIADTIVSVTVVVSMSSVL